MLAVKCSFDKVALRTAPSIQPTSDTWREMAEPSQSKEMSDSNTEPGTGNWVLVPFPPLTLALSEPSLLPCAQLSHL